LKGVIAVNEAAEAVDQPVRIVVVEDSATQLEALKRMLVKEGYAVSVARNGVEGLAMVKDLVPDLVISDILMPEMSGFELCRHIKEDEGLADIPVILLTSLNDPKDVIKGLECRADNFITKPYDEKYLLSRISYILLSRVLHLEEKMDLGIEIYFAGHKYYINSDRKQILNLLLSTYETAVQKNNELLATQEVLKELNERLEERVAERTASLLQEIAERKRAEETKNRLYEELKDLYNNAPCGYHSIDGEGNFTGINDTELAWVGYAREEIIGRKRFFDILSPLSRDEYARTLSTINKDGSDKDMELDLLRKDGTILNALLSQSAIGDAESNQLSIRATVFDISERKKLEEQLRHSQKLENIGELAGGIAHDFNNILNAIIGFSSIIQMKMAADDPLQATVNQVLTAADRAANLTRSLLAFSRNQIMAPMPTELNEIVRDMEKFLRRVIGEDIELCVKLTEERLDIFTDRGQIEQVLMNLATNARDAMPRGGTLTIVTADMEIDDDFCRHHGYGKAGKCALVTVADTGTGMNPETTNRIFEPFFTTKGVNKGTGLGLSIAYGIIKQHKGYIDVYSEQDQGTTFSIYLPITKVEHVSKERVFPLPPRGGSETILFADDDESIRNLVAQVLRGYDYNVIIAEDGVEAINSFVEHKGKIDLLLFDMIMPKKNGKEAYDEIRKLDPHIKSLFLSGYAADLLEQKGQVAEKLEVVTKPISPLDLLRKIREVLDKPLVNNRPEEING